MPELPEVETVRAGLAPLITGRRVVAVEVRTGQLRRPVPPELRQLMTGASFTGARRRGKYLLLDTDRGLTLLVHLGMTGRLLIEAPGRRADPAISARHDHIVMTLDDGNRLTYNDARRFGAVEVFRTDREHPSLAAMGPEPLGPDFDGESLTRAFAGKRSPVKTALLDQSLVAGIGNIYACEALWRARVSPLRQAQSLTGPEAERLAVEVRSVLNDAIAAGGSSLRDYRNAEGERGAFQERFAVYGREGKPCPRCREPIVRVTQAGRSTFHCASCQS